MTGDDRRRSRFGHSALFYKLKLNPSNLYIKFGFTFNSTDCGIGVEPYRHSSKKWFRGEGVLRCTDKSSQPKTDTNDHIRK